MPESLLCKTRYRWGHFLLKSNFSVKKAPDASKLQNFFYVRLRNMKAAEKLPKKPKLPIQNFLSLLLARAASFRLFIAG